MDQPNKNRKRSCHWVRDQLPFFETGRLSGLEAERVRGHLEDCITCAQLAQRERQLAHWLQEGDPAAGLEASPDFISSTLARARQTVFRSVARGPIWRWGIALAAGTSLFLLGLAVGARGFSRPQLVVKRVPVVREVVKEIAVPVVREKVIRRPIVRERIVTRIQVVYRSASPSWSRKPPLKTASPAREAEPSPKEPPSLRVREGRPSISRLPGEAEEAQPVPPSPRFVAAHGPRVVEQASGQAIVRKRPAMTAF